ncbi:MAG: LysM peptidoglycan-binding domain-containing protein [Lachnospiraceae bacterium]|nr:LysM peptidoglycan-binding domain-containing protein [Lachnospiraceae bacterium]
MQTACSRYGIIHTVEEGDTLYRLGKQYNVKVSSLIYANPCADIYDLHPGDQICIPKNCSGEHFLKNIKNSQRSELR